MSIMESRYDEYDGSIMESMMESMMSTYDDEDNECD